jgi:hypothetical protein
MLATQNRISIFKPRKDKKGYTQTLLTIPQLKSRLTRHGISYKMKMNKFGMLTMARLKKGLIGYSPPPEYSLREPLDEPKARGATSAATLMTIIETMVETRPKTIERAVELLAAKGLLPAKLSAEFKATAAAKPARKQLDDRLRELEEYWARESESDNDDDDSFDPFVSFDKLKFGKKRRPKARPRTVPL